MSSQYKFRNPDGVYFVSFSVVHWVDVFIRGDYRDILLDSWVETRFVSLPEEYLYSSAKDYTGKKLDRCFNYRMMHNAQVSKRTAKYALKLARDRRIQFRKK